MCNLYTQSKSVDEVARLFRDLQIPLGFPEGLPNLAPRDIATTDPGAIVRAANEAYELAVRRWSRPRPAGKPVHNFPAHGREFPDGPCIIVAAGSSHFMRAWGLNEVTIGPRMFAKRSGGMLTSVAASRSTRRVTDAWTMPATGAATDAASYAARQSAK